MGSTWTEEARRRYETYRHAPVNWDPVEGGRRPLISWNDAITVDLGPATAFDAIADRMLSGNYYPPDAIECFGPWIDENRAIHEGDRMLQRARLLPFSHWPGLWSMTEIFIAERTATTCEFGYVTTRRHFGKGLWQASLQKVGDRLELKVQGLSGPASWQFWLGLPIARFLQKKAWRRAIQEFRKLAQTRLDNIVTE